MMIVRVSCVYDYTHTQFKGVTSAITKFSDNNNFWNIIRMDRYSCLTLGVWVELSNEKMDTER